MLATYVPWWFKHYGTREIHQPRFIGMNVRVVADQEAAHPGFSAELRRLALALLHDSDQRTVRRAIGALAVVGILEDCNDLERAGMAAGRTVGGEAAAACFEIRRRAPAT